MVFEYLAIEVIGMYHSQAGSKAWREACVTVHVFLVIRQGRGSSRCPGLKKGRSHRGVTRGCATTPLVGV